MASAFLASVLVDALGLGGFHLDRLRFDRLGLNWLVAVSSIGRGRGNGLATAGCGAGSVTTLPPNIGDG